MNTLVKLTQTALSFLLRASLLKLSPPIRRIFVKLVLAAQHLTLALALKMLACFALAFAGLALFVFPHFQSSVVPTGRWAIMGFSYDGDEAEETPRLDETRREVLGSLDNVYQSQDECEADLQKLQAMRARVAMLTQYNSDQAAASVSATDAANRRVMTALCVKSDGSSKFAFAHTSDVGGE
ncbi:hypothetical protein IMX07_01745 [bacterium]|nr:hypothetical protein [bacterium]